LLLYYTESLLQTVQTKVAALQITIWFLLAHCGSNTLGVDQLTHAHSSYSINPVNMLARSLNSAEVWLVAAAAALA